MTASVPVDLTAVAADLAAKLGAATPGPWGVDRDRTGGYDLVDEDGQFIADRLGAMDEDNARLIVAAVNAAPALLDERAALLQQVADANAARDLAQRDALTAADEVADLRAKVADAERRGYERGRRDFQFQPEGDNHHNAALCPYCSPDGAR